MNNANAMAIFINPLSGNYLGQIEKCEKFPIKGYIITVSPLIPTLGRASTTHSPILHHQPDFGIFFPLRQVDQTFL